MLKLAYRGLPSVLSTTNLTIDLYDQVLLLMFYQNKPAFAKKLVNSSILVENLYNSDGFLKFSGILVSFELLSSIIITTKINPTKELSKLLTWSWKL